MEHERENKARNEKLRDEQINQVKNTIAELFRSGSLEEQVGMADFIMVLQCVENPLKDQILSPLATVPIPTKKFMVVEVLKGASKTDGNDELRTTHPPWLYVVGDTHVELSNMLLEPFVLENIDEDETIISFTKIFGELGIIAVRYVASERVKPGNYLKDRIFESPREASELIADIKAILAKEEQTTE